MIYNQSATTDELARKTSRPSGAGFSFAQYVLPLRSMLLMLLFADIPDML